MDRSTWDRLVSSAGAVTAVALIVLGAAAIFGGLFGQQNVRDRLEPQNISFPPAEAMSSEESAEVGDYAGERVDTGTEAEAFARYIGLHLAEVNEGKTYSETSTESRTYAAEVGANPTPEEEARIAELEGQVQTLFRGETLRAILLNAYGWWMAASIALYTGIALVVAGAVLGILAILGFRHAKRAAHASAPPSEVARAA